jgi:hypothetical protein
MGSLSHSLLPKKWFLSATSATWRYVVDDGGGSAGCGAGSHHPCSSWTHIPLLNSPSPSPFTRLQQAPAPDRCRRGPSSISASFEIGVPGCSTNTRSKATALCPMPAQVGTHDGGGGRILRHENRMPVASSEVTDSQRMCRREWASDMQSAGAEAKKTVCTYQCANGHQSEYIALNKWPPWFSAL